MLSTELGTFLSHQAIQFLPQILDEGCIIIIIPFIHTKKPKLN